MKLRNISQLKRRCSIFFLLILWTFEIAYHKFHQNKTNEHQHIHIQSHTFNCNCNNEAFRCGSIVVHQQTRPSCPPLDPFFVCAFVPPKIEKPPPPPPGASYLKIDHCASHNFANRISATTKPTTERHTHTQNNRNVKPLIVIS